MTTEENAQKTAEDPTEEPGHVYGMLAPSANRCPGGRRKQKF